MSIRGCSRLSAKWSRECSLRICGRPKRGSVLLVLRGRMNCSCPRLPAGLYRSFHGAPVAGRDQQRRPGRGQSFWSHCDDFWRPLFSRFFLFGKIIVDMLRRKRISCSSWKRTAPSYRNDICDYRSHPSRGEVLTRLTSRKEGGARGCKPDSKPGPTAR